MLGMYLVAWFVLRETCPGRHVYALGNNPEAARLIGIPRSGCSSSVYTLAGTDLRHRRVAVRRADRRWRPARRADREPGQHYRGRSRRHQSVRRTRHDHRHARSAR